MKQNSIFTIKEKSLLNPVTYLLKTAMRPGEFLPADIRPGQFVEVGGFQSSATFLRRPISINFADYENNELWLVVKRVGPATAAICDLPEGGSLELMLPLGNGFSIPETSDCQPLLVGGGVGIAPLLYMGKVLLDHGIRPRFVLGGRTDSDIIQKDLFSRYGDLYVSTEDGSDGEKGFVTANTIFESKISHIYCCGPLPMMKAVADIARRRDIYCEVSLENRMACGLGACLCCVENTTDGHRCVCTDGPVFNINNLTWQTK